VSILKSLKVLEPVTKAVLPEPLSHRLLYVKPPPLNTGVELVHLIVEV
jgi:hypothetical protein